MVLGRIFKQCFLLGLASTGVQKGEGRSRGAEEKDTEKAAWLQAEIWGWRVWGERHYPCLQLSTHESTRLMEQWLIQH